MHTLKFLLVHNIVKKKSKKKKSINEHKKINTDWLCVTWVTGVTADLITADIMSLDVVTSPSLDQGVRDSFIRQWWSRFCHIHGVCLAVPCTSLIWQNILCGVSCMWWPKAMWIESELYRRSLLLSFLPSLNDRTTPNPSWECLRTKQGEALCTSSRNLSSTIAIRFNICRA